MKLADAVIVLTTDDKELKQGLDKAEGTVASGAGRMGGVFKSALGTALGVGIFSVAQNALSGLTGMISDGIGDAREAVGIQKQLAQVIETTGGAAGMTAEEVNALSESLSNVTNYEDDAITAGQNLLLTFTNIGQEVFPQATETILDMSQALGQDMKSSAMQLGKALNDPVKGIGALSRVGVSFTEQQKEMIKSMAAAGDMAGAQKVILEELAKEFGGQAKAQADPLIQLENAWGNLKETLGGAVLPVINRLAQAALPYLQTAIKTIGVGVTEFFTLIDKGWGVLGAFQFAIYEAFGDNRITQAIGTVIDFVQNLISVVRGIFTGEVFEDEPAWVVTLVHAGTVAKDAVAAMVDGILTLFDYLGRTIDEGGYLLDWADKLPPWMNGIVAAFGGFVSTLQGFWNTHGAAILQTVRDAYARVRDSVLYVLLRVDAVVDQYLAIIETRWRTHGSVVGGVTETMYAQAMGFYKTFIHELAAFLERDQGMIGRLWDKHGKEIVVQTVELYQNIVGIALGGLATLTGMSQAQLDTNLSAWYEWDGTLTALMRNIWTLLGTVVENGMSLVLGQIEVGLYAINGHWQKAKDSTIELFTTMWNSLGEIIATAIDNWIIILTGFNWRQIGEDIMRGIGLGMAQGVSWITDAASAAYNAARRVLGIESPSKLAAQGIGVPLAQGIGVGMRDELARMQSGFAGSLNGLISGLGNQAAAGASYSIVVNVNGGSDAAGVGAAARDGLLEAMRSLGM